MTFTNSAAIFVPIPVKGVVVAFYSPMVPVELEHSLSIGTFWSMVGDAIYDFMGLLATSFLDGMPSNGKNLAGIWKGEVTVQLGGSPD